MLSKKIQRPIHPTEIHHRQKKTLARGPKYDPDSYMDDESYEEFWFDQEDIPEDDDDYDSDDWFD